MLTYSVNVNKYGAVDIAFNNKPAPEVLEQLKAKGFKWFKTGKCWSTFKFNNEHDCIDWINEVLANSYQIKEFALNEPLKVKVINNTLIKEKALKTAKNSVKSNYTCEEYKLTAYYDKIKPELKAIYGNELQEKMLLLRENGYAVIDPVAFEGMKASDRNKLLKNYVVYSI